MADLVQTPANVSASVKVIEADGLSGGAINAGMPLYYDQANTQWTQALAAGTANQAGANGIAIAENSAPGANQPVKLFKAGTIKLGATLTKGQTYCLSHNTGLIAPISDLTTNDYVVILGVATDTANIQTPPNGMFASGVQHA